MWKCNFVFLIFTFFINFILCDLPSYCCAGT